MSLLSVAMPTLPRRLTRPAGKAVLSARKPDRRAHTQNPFRRYKLDMRHLKSAGFVVWALVVCPLIGVLAVIPTHGDGGAWTFILRFCVLPAVLAAIGGLVIQRRPALVIPLSVVAGVMGLGYWFLIILLAAASGVYDT